MAPASILRKRAGPVQGVADEPMYDALLKLSTSSKPKIVPSDRRPLLDPYQPVAMSHAMPMPPANQPQNQAGHGMGQSIVQMGQPVSVGAQHVGAHQVRPQHASMAAPAMNHPGSHSGNQPMNHSGHQPMNQSVNHPANQTYSMAYQQPMAYQQLPYQQMALYPQSPPQEPLASPQTPDFGEKRRRVNSVGTQRGHQMQQQTPQTPSSSGFHAEALGRPELGRPELGRPDLARHELDSAAGANPHMAAANMLAPQDNNVQLAPMPGMPFLMDPFGSAQGSAQTTQSRPAKSQLGTTQLGATQLATDPRLELAPALTPVVPTEPTTAVTKPTFAPSLALPPRAQRPHYPLPATPATRPWKPQDIVLPKVVDGAPYSDCDDKGGHYIIRAGEWFAGRYLIIKLLGQGTFGKVAQAWDERSRQYCAIKIIRAVPKYRDASKIELRVLTLLGDCDPHCQRRCVRMRESFDYRNHVCIVTDLHDISVYDFLKENKFLPFPGHHIHSFAKQILTSVAFIHAMGLVHTDLKPENVLLTSSASHETPYRRSSRSRKAMTRRELDCTDVTLIDFGSAVFDDEYHSSVVSTRHYRAPEIILGSGWSFPCDMWSIGCLLVELCTGKVLFETRDDLEHLHMMEHTLRAKFSSTQLAQSSQTASSSLIASRAWPPKLAPLIEQNQIDNVNSMRLVSQLVHASTASSADRTFWDGFHDLVSRLMTLDPKQRITAQEALEHPWIMEGV